MVTGLRLFVWRTTCHTGAVPTKPVTQPEPWATAGVYPASNYPATLPWGDPHPDAGNPTPWGGQPRTNATGLVGFASNGAVPLQAQAADIWNEEVQRVVDLTRWTFLGTSAADEDAHPLETDATGLLNLAMLMAGGNLATTPGLRVIPTVGAAAAATISGGADRALLIDNSSATSTLDVSNSTGGAITASGNPASDAVFADTVTGNAIRAVVTGAGSGNGLSSLGGNDAASRAVVGTAGHVDGHAVEGVCAAGAGAMSSAILGRGFGAGAGVFALAEGTGYGLVVQADQTTPARAAIRAIPQDADPTTNEQGALLFSSARGPTGKWRTYTTQWESVHSSDKGWVHRWGASAAGGPIAGGSGNLSLVQITPEETGEVLVEATGSLEFSIDTGACTVALWDVTAALNISTQIERGPDTDGAGPNVRSFSIRGTRTLPDTATRTFAIVITATAGTITYDNVICDVHGVQ